MCTTGSIANAKDTVFLGVRRVIFQALQTFGNDFHRSIKLEDITLEKELCSLPPAGLMATKAIALAVEQGLYGEFSIVIPTDSLFHGIYRGNPVAPHTREGWAEARTRYMAEQTKPWFMLTVQGIVDFVISRSPPPAGV